MTIHTANRRSGRYKRSPYMSPMLRDVCRTIVRFGNACETMGRQMTAALGPALASLIEVIAAQADIVTQCMATEDRP